MKVLLINIGHSRSGGAFTVYLNTADMLRKAGIDVVFFALHSTNELPCEQSEYFAGVVPQSRPIKYILKRFYNKDAAQCLQKLIDNEHPDVAHAHLIWGGMAPSILDVLKRNHIPVVHTVHDYAMVCSLVTMRGTDGKECERCKGGRYFESFKTKCHKGSMLRSLIASMEIASRNKRHHPIDLIDHFIFVSQFTADMHAKMDERFKVAPQSILYNVPDEFFVDNTTGTMLDTFQSYFLYYGRISYEKGLNTLLEVFSRHPELTLKVVGTGPLEKELKEKYARDHTAMGVGSDTCACGSTGKAGKSYKNIQFLGYQSGKRLAELVRCARYVCVPSECYENNPMTIVESYTVGTPVIAARIGGIPEIVADGETGFQFKSGSQGDLEMALQKSLKLTESDYYQMKESVQRFSKNKFDREKYVKRLKELYISLMKLQ